MTTPLAVEELVVAAGQMALRRQHDRLRDHGLSPTAWLVLRELAQGPVSGMPLGEIARRIQMAASTVTAVTDQLAAERRVIRVRPRGNRRVVMASLTGAGRDLIALVHDGIAAGAISQVLDDSERAQLAALLKRMTQNAFPSAHRSSTPR